MAGQEGPGDLCKGMMKGARLDQKAEALKVLWGVRGKASHQVKGVGGGDGSSTTTSPGPVEDTVSVISNLSTCLREIPCEAERAFFF